jgi:DNA repair protein RecN (Recombination protein N)
MDIAAERRRRLEDLDGRDELAAALDAEIAQATAAAEKAAKKLTEKRRAAAKKMSAEVVSHLRDLGFLKSEFSVEVSGAELSAEGGDRTVYVFAPNPGESARPLCDIASSGEIARVMLSLKSVLAAHGAVSISVFDEIDANIGGEAGRAVGAKMKAVARFHQVIAITHLPQSAVYADRHLVVRKTVKNGRTSTEIGEVCGERRVAEIARMLGGEKLTSVVVKHAEELLEYGKKDG